MADVQYEVGVARDNADDGRRGLAWSGRFCSVTNVVNFYSSEEEVLRNSDGDMWPTPWRSYAWAKQEWYKGEWPDAQSIFLRNDGGWAFNTNTEYMVWDPEANPPERRRMSPEEANALTDTVLRASPFFGPFMDMSVCDTNGSAVALAQHPYLMSTCIPAESYAVGANPLPFLDDKDNIDMAVKYAKCKGESTAWFWGLFGRNNIWNHGFYINAPIIRTHGFYYEIINRIKGARNK